MSFIVNKRLKCHRPIVVIGMSMQKSLQQGTVILKKYFLCLCQGKVFYFFQFLFMAGQRNSDMHEGIDGRTT